MIMVVHYLKGFKITFLWAEQLADNASIMSTHPAVLSFHDVLFKDRDLIKF